MSPRGWWMACHHRGSPLCWSPTLTSDEV
jgi:hypothetical protein